MYDISLCTPANVDLDVELNILSQIKHADVAQTGMKHSCV